MTDGIEHGFNACFYPQFFENVAHMVFNSLFGDEQLLCDLAIRRTAGERLQHF